MSDGTDGSGAVPGEGDTVRIALMCVQNAGRSQMATAFAERERERRGLSDRVEILTGGTDPANEVHPVVVDAMAEVGIDIADREPRAITTEEMATCDYVATMGCSTLELDPAAGVDVRDWALDDPHGQDLDAVREIRATVESSVVALFDEFSDPADDRQSQE
ncbi:putative arsenate reductase [Halosimplex carlsbadense 2-9-1]|uniref:Putative arsenate reductase n=1 Tax=Halosimplex carlsbadense 2-9-1 TaxID=797114 RepID=M0CV53_9EURY|nr:putative arsenate reductase [Halosimplex carlsbadense 2-9-1]